MGLRNEVGNRLAYTRMESGGGSETALCSNLFHILLYAERTDSPVLSFFALPASVARRGVQNTHTADSTEDSTVRSVVIASEQVPLHEFHRLFQIETLQIRLDLNRAQRTSSSSEHFVA